MNTLDIKGKKHAHTDKNCIHQVAKYIVARRDWRGIYCSDVAGCLAFAQFASAKPALSLHCISKTGARAVDARLGLSADPRHPGLLSHNGLLPPFSCHEMHTDRRLLCKCGCFLWLCTSRDVIRGKLFIVTDCFHRGIQRQHDRSMAVFKIFRWAQQLKLFKRRQRSRAAFR